MPKIHLNSIIQLHPLDISTKPNEKDLYPIIRLDTDDNILVDKTQRDIIQKLDRHKNIENTSKKLKTKPHEIIKFLPFLIEVGFVKQIDENLLQDTREKIHPWFPNARKKNWKWLLNHIFIGLLLGFTAAGFVVGFSDSRNIPDFTSFFWTGDLFKVFVVNFLIGTFLVFLHEFAHLAVTIAVGGKGRINLSYRYIYPIYETENYFLANKSKEKRYATYLAGTVFDLFIIASVFWSFFIFDLLQFELGQTRDFLLAVILIQFVAVIWQFNVFLRTDIYNFISEFLEQPNLHNNMKKTAKTFLTEWKQNWLKYPTKVILRLFVGKKEIQEADDLRLLTKKERQDIKIYLLIFFVGTLVTTLLFSFYILPRDIVFITHNLETATKSFKTQNTTDLFKSLVVLIIVSFDYLLLLYLFLKRNLPHQIRKY